MNNLEGYYRQTRRLLRAVLITVTASALISVFGAFLIQHRNLEQASRLASFELASLNLIRSLLDEVRLIEAGLNQTTPAFNPSGTVYSMRRDMQQLVNLQSLYQETDTLRTLQRGEERLQMLANRLLDQPVAAQQARQAMELFVSTLQQLEQLHLLSADAAIERFEWRGTAGFIGLLAVAALLVAISAVLLLRTTGSLRRVQDQQLEEQAGMEQLRERLRLSERLNSLGMLVGGVAHDFNNLLTVILGRASALREELGTQHQSELDDVLVAGEHAALLTRQLLTFASKEPGEVAVVDVGQRINQARSMLANLVPESVDFKIRVNSATPAVRIDPVKLDQVFLNLLTNARDAVTKTGRIAVKTSSLQLADPEAGAWGLASGLYCHIVVEDDGVGMDELTVNKIFDPFFSKKQLRRSTGLGLSTVYGIVTTAGGAIRVDSEPGRGTRFELLLPATKDPPVSVAARAAVDSRDNGETILILEDDEAIRELMRTQLENRGYRVLAAEDGAAGVSLSARHPGRIDLVLSDVIMPELNGPEAVEQIRQAHPEVKVAFMSGYTDTLLADAQFGANGTALIRKPFRISELSARIRAILDSPEDSGNRQRK